jgi:hypothetical protein
LRVALSDNENGVREVGTLIRDYLARNEHFDNVIIDNQVKFSELDQCSLDFARQGEAIFWILERFSSQVVSSEVLS